MGLCALYPRRFRLYVRGRRPGPRGPSPAQPCVRRNPENDQPAQLPTTGLPGAGRSLISRLIKLMPELLADEERRALEPPQLSVLPIGLDKFPGQSSRIAALISNLDQVNERQFMFPGSVWLSNILIPGRRPWLQKATARLNPCSTAWKRTHASHELPIWITITHRIGHYSRPGLRPSGAGRDFQSSLRIAC